MLNFVNKSRFNQTSLDKAARGIIAPHPRPFATSVVLYRFGNSPSLAMGGEWWLEEFQLRQVVQWAALHRLEVPLAVRTLCAVLHDWGDMRYMVKARTKAPLLAWEGRSRNQQSTRSSRRREAIAPQGSTIGSNLRQLMVPGLSDPKLREVALLADAAKAIRTGASHIGGVPGMPAGARLQ